MTTFGVCDADWSILKVKISTTQCFYIIGFIGWTPEMALGL